MNYLTIGLWLAADLAEEPHKGPDYGKASPIGLLVVLLLLMGVFFLVWSMNRHLKRVPASFDTDTDADADTGTEPEAAAAPNPDTPPRESAG